MATIQGVYVALFGRPADPLGLAYFNTQTQNGADLTAIGDLSASAEYQTRFEGQSNAQIVASIYMSLFNRAPELAGLEFFVTALTNGTLNINNIAIAILDGAQGDDLATVNNKIAAANAYTAAIDTTAEVLAYSGDDAAALGRAFLTPVTLDEATIPDEAATDAAVAAMVAADVPGTTGGTFTLTTGLDFASTSNAFINGAIPSDFRFGTGNDTVEALTGTLGATDVLQDGSTADIDILNVRTGAGGASLAVASGVTVANIERLNVIASSDGGGVFNLGTFSGLKAVDIDGTITAGLTLNNYVASGATSFDFSGVTSGTGAITLNPGAGSTAAVSIMGGAGADVLTGGQGDDTISGGAGADTINGGEGANTLDAGAGGGAMTAGNGNNTLTGGSGADMITVGNGTNTITTGAGADTVIAGSGANTITGGDGGVTVTVGGGTNTITTGTGSDFITVSSGVGTNIIVTGAGGDSILLNGTGTSTLTGGTGADDYFIGGGSARINIGAGDTGTTLALADNIVAFTSGADSISFGLQPGAVGSNYVESGVGFASFAAADVAANAALNGTVQYYLADITAAIVGGRNGTGTPGDLGAGDSLLFIDRDLDGTYDQVVTLLGTTEATFAATDIVA